MSIDSPNLEGSTAGAPTRAGSRSRGAGSSSGPRRTLYVGKILSSAPASRSASSFTTSRTSLVRRVRAAPSSSSARRARPCSTRGDRRRAAFRFPPGTRASGHRPRGHDDPRGLDAAPRRRRPARGRLRPSRHERAVTINTVVVGFAPWQTSPSARPRRAPAGRLECCGTWRAPGSSSRGEPPAAIASTDSRAQPAPLAPRAATALPRRADGAGFRGTAAKRRRARRAVDGWLAGADDLAWVDWEQRKQERLLAA